jgi:hypothetical protein
MPSRENVKSAIETGDYESVTGIGIGEENVGMS